MYEKGKMEIKKFLQKSTKERLVCACGRAFTRPSFSSAVAKHANCSLTLTQSVLHVRYRNVASLAARLWHASTGGPLQNNPACKASLTVEPGQQVNPIVCTCVAATWQVMNGRLEQHRPDAAVVDFVELHLLVFPTSHSQKKMPLAFAVCYEVIVFIDL